MKNTDCQIPKFNLPSNTGIDSLEDNKNDFKCDLALLSILSCLYLNLSETILANINSKSSSKPNSFSFTQIADVECLEKIFTIPLLILELTINPLIFDSYINNFKIFMCI